MSSSQAKEISDKGYLLYGVRIPPNEIENYVLSDKYTEGDCVKTPNGVYVNKTKLKELLTKHSNGRY